ncbi:MAG: phosphoribosylaminoimidazolesuccinocarboxamide synthase [Candidatus Lokiarchaeota archaeon]|nr:phosphoribosylaminoimidazolesuccinocarboxamide synthase [Candidatus Lokiarchaeota archaeon]
MTIGDMDNIIKLQLNKTLKETNLSIPGAKIYQGKVRDNYILDDKRIIVATDRISAFDRVITTIPFKGELLNQISSFWFEKTKHIVKNHIIDIPDPNVSVTHQCETVPIEMIVRAYITGTAWRKYLKGEKVSGIELPKGLTKNQKLDDIVLTPSTKAESGHDIYISREEILKQNIIDKDIYEQMEQAALKLFNFGQDYCKKNGLILVDTKYEMGIKNGELMVIDEIHTQDSSRFWIADTYDDLFEKGEDPEILDKEFFRGWLMTTYPDVFPDIKPEQDIPPIREDVKIELAKRYFRSYKKITGTEYKPEVANVMERITENLTKAGYI